MATSTSDSTKESITLLKDIQIRDFDQHNAVPNSAIFFYNDTEPFCEVFVNPVCRSHPEFVSVRVRRCSFYPRFFPGVVYRSLGWSVSVVDDEGVEKFASYFGYEDFQSLNWVEDFFSERGYELEEFVERSVLLDDPERYLPGGVLTVRVEMFYECRAIFMDPCIKVMYEGLDLPQALPMKPIIKKKFILLEENTESNSNSEETEKGVNDSSSKISTEVEGESVFHQEQENKNSHKEIDYWKKTSAPMMQKASSATEKIQKTDSSSNAEETEEGVHDFSSKIPTEVDSQLKYLLSQEKNFPEEIQYWKEESVMMMEETFHELKEAFEMYGKLHCVKHRMELRHHPSIRNDCGLYSLEWDLYERLFTEVGLGPPKEYEFFSMWLNEGPKYLKKLARTLIINKHQQMHWKNCKEVYKKASEKPLIQIPEEQVVDRKCSLGSQIRELFFIYKETVRENQPEEPDHLLHCVSRFLKVFLNVIEVLANRLFHPFMPPLLAQYTINEEDSNDVHESEDELSTTSASTGVEREDEFVERFKRENGYERCKTMGIWFLDIETSDHKRLEIPFMTGSTTLGTLLRSASPVFDRMLETPMTEKSNRFLKIDDITYSTFSHFISYLKSGKVDVYMLQDCLDLYQLAHKYQVEQLLLDCSKKIEKKIFTPEQAKKVEQFSKIYGDDTLMSTVEAFFAHFRGTTAFWKLADDFKDEVALYPEMNSVMSVSDLLLENLMEGNVMDAGQQKEKYDFYE